MKARPRLAEDKLNELVELFSEHVKVLGSIVYSEKMDQPKIDHKRLRENGLRLEIVRRLQGNLSISPVVVKNASKQTAERKHSSWKLIEGDEEDIAVVVGKRVRTMLRQNAQVLFRQPVPKWARDIRDAVKNLLCRAGVDEVFWTGYIPKTETVWRTSVGDPPEALPEAHWNDGFFYEIPTLLAAVRKGHEAAASGTVKHPLIVEKLTWHLRGETGESHN